MNRVRGWHIELMAWRLVDAHRERAFLAIEEIDTPAYWRAVRASLRRQKALRRLVDALDREGFYS